MTRRILSISAISLVVGALVAHAALTFTVQDYSTHDLGDVVLSGNGCSQTVTMAAAGIFDLSSECQITTVTINGQSVDYPNTGTATLPSGASVTLTWGSANAVTIHDEITEAQPAP